MIAPILLEYGSITIRWYGILLSGGIVVALLVARWVYKRERLDLELLYSLGFYLIVGLIVGARFGYIVFYNLAYFVDNPGDIIKIWEGGLSSHGATIGLLLVYVLFYLTHKKKMKERLSEYTDYVVMSFPIVAMCVRLGNFINGEIIGRVTEFGRHPVQLYEAGLLFFIFWLLLFIYLKVKQRSKYLLTFLFVGLYFGGRFILEFFKEYMVFDEGLTMGQWLSIIPVIVSIIYFIKIKFYDR